MTDEQLVQSIAQYINANGYPPSVREVAKLAGYASSADGQRLVQRLVDKGLIERVPGIPRGLKIVYPNVPLRAVKMVADTEEMA